MTPNAQGLAPVSILILGQFYLWHFQTIYGIPFIQCDSRYPLREGEISPCESLNRCPACTIHQNHTELSIKAILVLLWPRVLAFPRKDLPQNSNPKFSKSRNPLWYNHPEQAQTHVNSVLWSRTWQNPTLGHFILCGSLHFVLISMQEQVHPARNFFGHVKDCTKPTLKQLYFMRSLPFPSPSVIDHYQIELVNPWGYGAMQVLPKSHI